MQSHRMRSLKWLALMALPQGSRLGHHIIFKEERPFISFQRAWRRWHTLRRQKDMQATRDLVILCPLLNEQGNVTYYDQVGNPIGTNIAPESINHYYARCINTFGDTMTRGRPITIGDGVDTWAKLRGQPLSEIRCIWIVAHGGPGFVWYLDDNHVMQQARPRTILSNLLMTDAIEGKLNTSIPMSPRQRYLFLQTVINDIGPVPLIYTSCHGHSTALVTNSVLEVLQPGNKLFQSFSVATATNPEPTFTTPSLQYANIPISGILDLDTELIVEALKGLTRSECLEWLRRRQPHL